MIVGVGDVDVSRGVDGDAHGVVELGTRRSHTGRHGTRRAQRPHHRGNNPRWLSYLANRVVPAIRQVIITIGRRVENDA